jgi:hypothetical protein
VNSQEALANASDPGSGMLIFQGWHAIQALELLRALRM